MDGSPLLKLRAAGPERQVHPPRELRAEQEMIEPRHLPVPHGHGRRGVEERSEELARLITRESGALTSVLNSMFYADAPGAAIVERVQNVAARLRGKAKYLAESRTAQSLGTRMKIQALVSGLPLLEELLVSEAIHPRTLYLALCSLAGPLAMLRLEEPMPPELPRYDHTDLLATFSRAEQAIDTVLDEGVSELYTDHVFELDKQRNVFHIFFEKAWRDRELVLGVRRGSGQTEADVEAWMAEALIGAQSLVTEMQKSRILGVARRKLDSHAELAASSSVTLYEIRPESKYLKAGERLLVFNPRGGARPAEIVLYVKNRDRAD